MLCFKVKFKFLINSQSAETDIPDIQFYDSESVRGGEKSRSFWLKRQSVLKFRALQKPGRENFPNLGRHRSVESFLVVLNSVKGKRLFQRINVCLKASLRHNTKAGWQHRRCCWHEQPDEPLPVWKLQTFKAPQPLAVNTRQLCVYP